jgi:hypothetical protein
MEADAALGGAARVVVAPAPGEKGFARSVVHADHQALLCGLPRIFQFLDHVRINAEMGCRLIEANQRVVSRLSSDIISPSDRCGFDAGSACGRGLPGQGRQSGRSIGQ